MPFDAITLEPGIRYAIVNNLGMGELRVLLGMIELQQNGSELTHKNLQEYLRIPQQRVSHFVQVLRLKGLIANNPEKRHTVMFL